MPDFDTDYTSTRNKSLAISFAVSIAFTMFICSFGSAIGAAHPTMQKNAYIVYCITIHLLVFLFMLQHVLFLNVAKKLKSKRLSDFADEFDAEKKTASEINKAGNFRKLYRKLRSYVSWAHLFYAGAFILGMCVSFFGLCDNKRLHAFVGLIIPFTLFAAYFYRYIYMMYSKYDWFGYSKEEEYPAIYKLAYKAEKACGIKGRIHIVFTTETNIGIAKVGRRKNGDISLIMGTGILDALSEEEMYNSLLHEFSHLSMTGYKDPTNNIFCNALIGEFDTPPVLKKITDWSITFFYFIIAFNREKYLILNSEFCEAATDKKAASLGNPEVFASALVKIGMIDWAAPLYPDYYAPDHFFFMQEGGREDVCTYSLDLFRRIFEDHNKRWFGLFQVEKQPRNATHPIIRERVKNIGMDLTDIKYSLPDRYEDTPFREECRRVFYRINQEIRRENADKVEEWKKEFDQKERLTAEFYEKDETERYNPEQFREILDAFSSTGKISEMVQLCKDVINNPKIDQYAKAFPIFKLGAYYLSHDDKEGLDLVYQAMELNSNYIDSGFDLIGSFCCRNGLEEEYRKYREKCTECMQYQADVVRERTEMRSSDKLSAETFDKEKLDYILENILRAGEGALKAVYLVHKTINDDAEGYASQVVLEFDPECEDEIKDRVMDKAFNFLDTRTGNWNYALLIYTPEIGKIVSKVKDCCIYKKEN